MIVRLLWPWLAVPALLLLVASCTAPPADPAALTIRVVPDTLPPGSTVYLTGDLPALGEWTPDGFPLKSGNDGSWSGNLAVARGTSLSFKITRGSWETEAVDSDGIEFPNTALRISRDTTVTIRVPGWRDTAHRRSVLSARRMANKAGNLELFENWRYRAGDLPPDTVNGGRAEEWIAVDPRLSPGQPLPPGWSGIGWFRLEFEVDSSLWNVPLAFTMIQAGASEVYLNGELRYRFGTVSATATEEQWGLELDPLVFIIPPRSRQVLTVRYSNHSAAWFRDHRFEAGFRCYLTDLDSRIANRVATVRSASQAQIFFSVVPLALALVHLLMFAFYPRSRENLYYALSMTMFAVVSFNTGQVAFITRLSQMIYLNTVTNVAANAAILFALLTMYAGAYPRLPRHGLVLVLIAAFFAATEILFTVPMPWLAYGNYGFFALVCLETLRVVFHDGVQQRWTWVVGLGFLVAIVAILFQIAINLELLDSLFGTRLIFVYGILALGIAVSVRLSHDFAMTRRDLEHQLDQVRELSRKALEQDRAAREEEVARRILEADNARKTRELEDARELQLAMLPRRIPSPEHLDIAMMMKTASEVGGDYYDFLMDENGTLTIAIGDATGHGMRAGTMVAAVKSLFTAFGNRPGIPRFFHTCSGIIKRMHLGNLFMAMLLVKFRDGILECSAAGMPPLLIWRHLTGDVEEVLLKGMPLGGPYPFPYETARRTLQPGDVVLLMSDGLPELVNAEGEMLDYPRIHDLFQEAIGATAEATLASLWTAAEAWAGETPLHDDTTLIVIHFGEPPASPGEGAET